MVYGINCYVLVGRDVFHLLSYVLVGRDVFHLLSYSLSFAIYLLKSWILLKCCEICPRCPVYEKIKKNISEPCCLFTQKFDPRFSNEPLNRFQVFMAKMLI